MRPVVLKTIEVVDADGDAAFVSHTTRVEAAIRVPSDQDAERIGQALTELASRLEREAWENKRATCMHPPEDFEEALSPLPTRCLYVRCHACEQQWAPEVAPVRLRDSRTGRVKYPPR